MSSIELADLENVFTYHAPFGNQTKRYQVLRDTGKDLGKVILTCCPESRERSLAITKLREAVMWANAAIACNEYE
jgi:hypothetical protein